MRKTQQTHKVHHIHTSTGRFWNFWQHVRCCVLLQGVSFLSLGHVKLLCSEGLFRLWVHQHGMTSPLSCGPFWWFTLPSFTSLWSPSSLSVTGLGAPLSSSLSKRRYMSPDWMNESTEAGRTSSSAIAWGSLHFAIVIPCKMLAKHHLVLMSVSKK